MAAQSSAKAWSGRLVGCSIGVAGRCGKYRQRQFFEAWVWLAQEIEEKEVAPELYPYGSRGPVGSHYLAAKHGVRWGDNLSEEEQ